MQRGFFMPKRGHMRSILQKNVACCGRLARKNKMLFKCRVSSNKGKAERCMRSGCSVQRLNLAENRAFIVRRMSNKLKVVELRAALEKRGLDTAGLKAVLVARLDAALANEQSQATAAVSQDDSKKAQKRAAEDDLDDDDLPPPIKRIKLDDVKKMNVAELRSALSDRGLSTSGRKQELMDRLTTALTKRDSANKGVDDEDEEPQAQADSSNAKIVTATKKGHAVLDKQLPDDIKSSYHVLEIGDEVYDAMLNFTNISGNNNKFYVIQVLESDDRSQYITYTRWGRVGAPGQTRPDRFYSADAAIKQFEHKFYEKTKNRWDHRHQFISHPGKYTMLEMDYEDNDNDTRTKLDKKKEIVPAVNRSPKQSKLDNRLAKFISLICNITMMRQQMVEIGYNAEKMPLGKLSKPTILKGYEVLKRIAAVLESSSSNRGALEELSNEFYTVIPHDFGHKSIRGQTICTAEHLKKKLEMVESLGQIEVARKVLVEDENEEDPAYVHYKRLSCKLEPLDTNTEEYEWIQQYLKNTHGQTHSGYNLELEQVFKVEKDGENNRFQKFVQAPNRMLLWHGSRLTNWTGILSQGLRIAPPEAPATGYMFGKGVYFADMVSKSANYCFTTSSQPTGVLLLCEVALGTMNELFNADYNADKLPAGKLSTKGVGQTSPDPSQSKVLPDGVIVPMGKPKQQELTTPANLMYNEYIVYHTSQIRMRYLLQVRFKYRYT